ncbi:MAG: TetR/AcrR family transcriptional regulator [Coriobacteriales bacterium]
MTRDGESIRQRRTRVQIKRALRELVLEMEPDKITVKAIADRALINRKTFYLYYDSIEALLFEELEETIVRFIAEVEQTPDDLEDFAGHAKRFFIFLAWQDESMVRLVMRQTPLKRGDRAL